MKNYDPKMHTAEHVLNQTMVRMFNCDRCFSAHINKKKSKCDYHFDRSLTDNEIREIESRINEIIKEDLPVTEKFLSREEAMNAYSLKRLPEDAGDKIRIVKVGSYDACPCIGPHISTTADIEQYRITSSSYHDGVLRIRFKL